MIVIPEYVSLRRRRWEERSEEEISRCEKEGYRITVVS